MERRRGFTLVELLVAIALFSVGVTIAVGGFVNALKTQRQNSALLSANSNMSLALEQMNREVRTGFDFCVNGQTCTSNELAFKNAAGEVVTYRKGGGVSDGGIERRVGGGAFARITADNVNIRYLTFRPIGNAVGDNVQPRIVINLGVSARERGVDESVIHLQTTVSPRTLDT